MHWLQGRAAFEKLLGHLFVVCIVKAQSPPSGERKKKRPFDFAYKAET